MVPHRRNMVRSRCHVLESPGSSVARLALTLRVSPLQGRSGDLRAFFRKLCAHLVERPGIAWPTGCSWPLATQHLPWSRPHFTPGRAVHQLLRSAELYGGTRRLHHRPDPIRTGLTKVGMPGATLGLSAEDPSVAEFLKGFGYATGQFGKNLYPDGMVELDGYVGQLVQKLEAGKRLPPVCRAAIACEVAGELQGVPAACKGGELQH
jgi:hypothetical protein